MPVPPPPLTRRAFLVGGTALAAAVVAGCSGGDDGASSPSTAAGDQAAQTSAAGVTGGAADPTTDPSAGPTDDASGDASTTAAPAGPAEFVVQGSGDDDVVALTFHTNGDLDLADRLISTLAERDAVATSFMIGEWLAANPSMADRMAGTFEFANHTWTHPTFSSLSAAQMADEIGRCKETLIELTGGAGRFFRPSGVDDGTVPPAATILDVAGEAGYEVILGWDVEPYDYRDPGAAAIEQAVRQQVGPGSVISLHFGHSGTVQALPAILDLLDERGLRTVTASELLGR